MLCFSLPQTVSMCTRTSTRVPLTYSVRSSLFPATRRTVWPSGTTSTAGRWRPYCESTPAESRPTRALSGVGQTPGKTSGKKGRWWSRQSRRYRSSSQRSWTTASAESPWTTSVSWKDIVGEVSGWNIWNISRRSFLQIPGDSFTSIYGGCVICSWSFPWYLKSILHASMVSSRNGFLFNMAAHHPLLRQWDHLNQSEILPVPKFESHHCHESCSLL